MKPDKDYKNAISCYLDYLLTPEGINSQYENVLEYNSEKALTRYIKSFAPKDFTFSTPMFAWWDLTSACNLRCIHCLYNDTPYNDESDLTDEEAYELADTLIDDFEIAQIALTGGEVFLRPKTLTNLITKFKENNIAILLATNAILINDEHIDFLANNLNFYTDRIQVSIDGATLETYKKIRQTDLFDKVLENISKLVQKGLRITVVFTANTINHKEAVATYELAERLGVSEFAVTKMLFCNDSHKPLMLSNKEKILLAQKLIEAQKGKKTKLNLGLFSPIELINDEEIFSLLNTPKYKDIISKANLVPARSCNCHDRISVRSDGRVYMCMEAECPSALMGNLRENSLPEIWEKRTSNVFFQPRTTALTGCQDCSFNKFCDSGCMAKAYKRTGDLNSPEIECKFCKRR